MSRAEPARIAARQLGVITREQLLAAGVGRGAIDHRIAHGELHSLHRGVYALGHPVLPPLGRELAALLACGAGAVLSHRSAGWVWGISHLASYAEVDVTVPGRHCRAPRGVRLHRVEAIEPVEQRERRGILLTAPARTLVDLAGILPLRELERALAEAQATHIFSARELESQLARSPRRRGVGVLRSLFDGQRGPALTRSEAERRLLALVRGARLPVPELNVGIAGHEVDFLWRAEQLVLEVDGYAFHSSRAAFERDRRRDGDLHARGLRVMRVTWHQIDREPAALIARLAASLALAPVAVAAPAAVDQARR